MALCYWDAQTMGNGMGTSVISGDCAPMLMGDKASNECVSLYAQGQKGIDAVAECVEIGNTESEYELKRMGWTYSECFSAIMGN